MKLRSGKNVPFFGKNIPKRTKTKNTENVAEKVPVPPPVFPDGHECTEKRLENQMGIKKARRISRRALDFGFESKSYSPIKRNFFPDHVTDDVTQNQIPIFQSTMLDLNDSESESSSVQYSFCAKKIPKGGVIPENGEFGQTRSFEEELGLSALNDSDLEKISESENYHSETSNLDLTP